MRSFGEETAGGRRWPTRVAEERPPSHERWPRASGGPERAGKGAETTQPASRMIRPAMTLARDLVRRRPPTGASPKRRNAPGRTLSPMPSEQKGAYGGHLAPLSFHMERHVWGLERTLGRQSARRSGHAISVLAGLSPPLGRSQSHARGVQRTRFILTGVSMSRSPKGFNPKESLPEPGGISTAVCPSCGSSGLLLKNAQCTGCRRAGCVTCQTAYAEFQSYKPVPGQAPRAIQNGRTV